MKKRLAIIGLLLAVVAVGGAVAYRALTPTPGVTVENFKRLHDVTREETVIAILGEPGENCALTLLDSGSKAYPGHYQKRWAGNGLTIELLFLPVPNASYAVKGRCMTSDGSTIPLKFYQPTLWDRVHSWLLG